MYLSIALSLLLSTPTVIGHDIEVVWEKGMYDSTGGTIFGYGIAAGDVDGDGHLDIAASWGEYDRVEEEWFGGVYIFLGNPLDTFADMTIWTHEQIGSRPNILVMDVNGDGIDDLMAGIYGADKVIGFFGPLEDEQKEDFWMVGEPLPSSGLGRSMANAGDVNSDGWNDLILGSPDQGAGVFGAAYIYYGGLGFGPGYRYPPDVILPGSQDGGDEKRGLGWHVGGGGDFNADGYDDVIVGASYWTYIYFGGESMDSIEDVVFPPENSGHMLIRNWVDLIANGDHAHALVGSDHELPQNDERTGKVYVLFGGEDWDDVDDLEIVGRTDSSYLTLAGGVCGVGDADHDGRDDFVVAAPTEVHSKGNTWSKGAVYFYRGGNVIDAEFDGWLEGEGKDEQPGWKLAEGGDFDGDGRDEFLVSSYATHPTQKVWLCKFTGVGIEEERGKDSGLTLELSATVTHDAVQFYYDKPQNKEASLSIYNVSGALVRRYNNLRGSSVEWNLKDEQGRRVPAGVYTACLDIGSDTVARKIVVLR